MEAAAPGPEFQLSRVRVRLICAGERVEWDTLMRAHHYLGLTAMVGRSLRYVAEVDGRWLALLGWASPALKCASRDAWIGWSPTLQWQRLALIANNSRFLILPGLRVKNLASRILGLNLARLSEDWRAAHGHGLVLCETFIDPAALPAPATARRTGSRSAAPGALPSPTTPTSSTAAPSRSGSTPCTLRHQRSCVLPWRTRNSPGWRSR